ncbi:MAG: GNAT family N-acetyltransferase [Proteobacteria bacterium]|nr:GNAT family N-acetyltransferase [Pseudomonadota bacterium]
MSTSTDITIDEMNEADVPSLVDLIRRNLSDYAEAGTVLASTFRRLDKFQSVYSVPGTLFVVARERETGKCVGGAGIGPLQGLSPGEGLGEIRDLVVDPAYRSHGIGARLLKRCLTEAKNISYSRLYLETTPQMEHAQKLFIRNGFRPVTTGAAKISAADAMPCYYIMENLESHEG